MLLIDPFLGHIYPYLPFIYINYSFLTIMAQFFKYMIQHLMDTEGPRYPELSTVYSEGPTNIAWNCLPTYDIYITLWSNLPLFGIFTIIYPYLSQLPFWAILHHRTYILVSYFPLPKCILIFWKRLVGINVCI